METNFRTPLITEELLGSKFARVCSMFIYDSKILNCSIYIPPNFICDYESVPIFKASSKRAGVIHDYLCRTDSNPIVTKQLADSIYLEAQTYRDSLLDESKPKKFYRFLTRHLKTLVVRITPGYFHKHKVHSKLEELI